MDGQFGFDVALVPDLDGDGRAEVLVGQLGAEAVVLAGKGGTPLFRLGDATLGPRTRARGSGAASPSWSARTRARC